MIEKTNINYKKILVLFFITVFYSVMFYLVSLVFKNNSVSIKTLMEFIKSITDRWFIYIYIILYLLIPYINKIIINIEKKDYKNLLIILLVFFSVWPTFWTKITSSDNGYGIVNFICPISLYR